MLTAAAGPSNFAIYFFLMDKPDDWRGSVSQFISRQQHSSRQQVDWPGGKPTIF